MAGGRGAFLLAPGILNPNLRLGRKAQVLPQSCLPPWKQARRPWEPLHLHSRQLHPPGPQAGPPGAAGERLAPPIPQGLPGAWREGDPPAACLQGWPAGLAYCPLCKRPSRAPAPRENKQGGEQTGCGSSNLSNRHLKAVRPQSGRSLPWQPGGTLRLRPDASRDARTCWDRPACGLGSARDPGTGRPHPAPPSVLSLSSRCPKNTGSAPSRGCLEPPSSVPSCPRTPASAPGFHTSGTEARFMKEGLVRGHTARTGGAGITGPFPG